MKILFWISALLIQLLLTRLNALDPLDRAALASYHFANRVLEIYPSNWTWFYEALLTGRDENLRSHPFMQSFMVIGLFHMMVGTGTHVLALEKILEKIFFFLPQRPKKFFILSLLVGFCFINRLKPPCVRAVVGRIFFHRLTISEFLQVDLQMATTFLCLFIEPRWMDSLSFQFSCAATLALAMASSFKDIEGFKKRFTAAALCSLVTLPLLFGIQPCVSWLVLPTNTVALFLFEAVFMPITLINVTLPFLSSFTEKILTFVLKISDFLALYEKPLMCMDERKLKCWGLIYLSVVYLSWRAVLPWFFRRVFFRNQTQFQAKLSSGP